MNNHSNANEYCSFDAVNLSKGCVSIYFSACISQKIDVIHVFLTEK